MQSRRDASVAIIGAGIAGLSAADALINRHGFTAVKIYEGSERIGGRILTVNFGKFLLRKFFLGGRSEE